MRFPHAKVSLSLLLTASLLAACQAQTPPPITPINDGSRTPNTEPLDPQVEVEIWRVKGSHIVDGRGEEVRLKGIAFGNQVWEEVEIPSAHHTGSDYEVVAGMGMNTVRFYLTYRTFEENDRPFDYKQSGWDWLDQNVEWAKAQGIRLVLNMHAPAGGYQSQGEGEGLWKNPENQERFIALWRAIAERYRAEPTVAGFDLLNEPIPVESIEQWKDLAQRTIEQIREVNQHHMIFVERVNAVNGDWSENEDRNFFRVDDANVVYEFHFYKPFHFTHQNASWSDFAVREAWYPDERVPEVDWFQLKTEGVAQSEALPPGDSDWTMLETEAFTVYEGNTVIGKPFLVCDQSEGKVTFDSLSLTRLGGGPKTADEKPASAAAQKGPSKAAVQEERTSEIMFEVDLDTTRGWYFWTQNGEGNASFDPDGHGDQTAVSISNTTGPANLGADPLRFFTEAGSEYTLMALAKGQGLGEKSNCRLRLEFYSSKVPVLPRSKAYLNQELAAYLAWGRKQNVPLYLGEFGSIRQSFLPGRGGLTWVEDMMSVLNENQVHFAYHDYHEPAFGLFLSQSNVLPNQYALYQPLHELFVKSLSGSGKVPWQQANVTPAAEQAAPDDSQADSQTTTSGDIESFD